MTLFEIHYRHYRDVWRVKRAMDGAGSTAKLTDEEARRFLMRNRSRYPRANLVKVRSSSATSTADKGKRRTP